MASYNKNPEYPDVKTTASIASGPDVMYLAWIEELNDPQKSGPTDRNVVFWRLR